MTPYIQNYHQGYRLRITAYEANRVPLEIFVYQRLPVVPGETEESDKFTNIASPADLEEYPTNTPTNLARPFFREASIDLVFRSVDTLEESWTIIRSEVSALIDTLDTMDTLNITEEITIGATADTSSSSSSSLSSLSSSSSSSSSLSSLSSSSSSSP